MIVSRAVPLTREAVPSTTPPGPRKLTVPDGGPPIGGTGTTVAKINYGLYRFNPGVGLADSANPNQSAKSVTYAWTDTKVCAACIPGDGLYQPGEEGNQTASALSGTLSVDPNLKQPYSNQATGYLEQQIGEGMGARVGFVLYKVYNQYATVQSNRPASIYSVPFAFLDRGADNVSGSADDQNLTFYGIPNALISSVTPSTALTSPTCRSRMSPLLIGK